MNDNADRYSAMIRKGSEIMARAYRIATARGITMEAALLRIGVNVAAMEPEARDMVRVGLKDYVEQTPQ